MLSIKQKITHIDDQLSAYIPMRILEIELGHPLPTISAFDEKKGRYYQRVCCLVRLHTQPLGLVELTIDKDELESDVYAQKIWNVLNAQINDHLKQDGLPSVTELTTNGLPVFNTPCCIEGRERYLADAPFVSVIVPTHERPEQLAACLNSLLSLRYPHYEIIVVDNAPDTDTTADLVEQFSHRGAPVHYICEDIPGPSWARNRGMMVARGKILAFVDDDVVVDSYWLVDIVRGFGVAENVACVTSLVLPLELETPAQFLFEEAGGFNRGFIRRIFDLKVNQSKLPLHPYMATRFGTGAGMAFTAAFIRGIGGFDPALGRIGPVRCSQDIAVFFQVLAGGYKLVYEPASLIYHLHRREYIHLRKQTYNYGVGFTAYLVKSLLDNPRLILDFIGKLPYALFFILTARSAQNSKKTLYYPKELTFIRRKGMLYGPFAYFRSRWEIRKLPKRTLALDESHAITSVER
jgi:glycosyltransferase involved in cell wall biosynthesis